MQAEKSLWIGECTKVVGFLQIQMNRAGNSFQYVPGQGRLATLPSTQQCHNRDFIESFAQRRFKFSIEVHGLFQEIWHPAFQFSNTHWGRRQATNVKTCLENPSPTRSSCRLQSVEVPGRWGWSSAGLHTSRMTQKQSWRGRLEILMQGRFGTLTASCPGIEFTLGPGPW